MLALSYSTFGNLVCLVQITDNVSRAVRGSEWMQHGEYDILDPLGISAYCVPLIFGEFLAILNTLISVLMM